VIPCFSISIFRVSPYDSFGNISPLTGSLVLSGREVYSKMDLLPLIAMFLILLTLMALGIPIAFSFGLSNLLALLLFVGLRYVNIIVSDCISSISNFLYIAFPLFILMGELFHYSGMAEVLIRILTGWLRGLPGSLGITTIVGNAVFGALSGSSMAACAAMGSATIPLMLKNGYSRSMATGVIAIGGVLSILIPPSAIVVIYAGLSYGSIGRLLIGGITPGIILTFLFSIYIGFMFKFKPRVSDEQKSEGASVSYSKLVIETLKYLLPLSFVIFAVTVTIYMGIATPSEAAAAGCVTSVIVIAAYGRFNLRVLKAATLSSMMTTSMVFFIVTGSTAFSHLLFLTGSSQKLIELILEMNFHPLIVATIMLVIVLILGCFIDVFSIMFITLPIFNPLVEKLGFDPIWFGLLYIYCIAFGAATPPFGVNLFVTKSVSPPEVTLQEVYRGVYPFILIVVALLPVLILIPEILTYLPNMSFAR
jgi:tripartite ATP-independent transporter DctM subunit